jgi:hypothetical protein
MQRVITRHSNRKLYDPSARRYVSLSDIVDLVVGGDSVKVVEHPGGQDATARILAQSLVDLIKRRAESIPAGLMETLVRLAGGSGLPTPPDATGPIKDLAARARTQAETIATKLVARGRLGIEEALSLRKEVEDAIHSGVEAAESATRRQMASLRPGRSVRTIAGLALELKALEAIVEPRARRGAPRPEKKHSTGNSSKKPRS